MTRKLAFGALATLIAIGQVGTAFADTTTGLDSNRTALGLPTNARVGTCVAGAGCGASGDSSQLIGAPSIVVPLLLAGVIGGGIAIGVEKHHAHYTPLATSPVSP